MIWHAAEVWAALAVCFLLGALVGSLLHRTVALTGARRAQASVIQVVDGVVRSLERVLMPWRGSVPAILPQTVPIPPPDFRHVVEAPEVAPPTEPDRHWDGAAVAAAPVAPAETSLPPAPVAHIRLPRPDEALASEPMGGFQPLALQAPRNETADPLHLINGLTKRHTSQLAKIGIFHFSQIASWTPQEVLWVSAYLGVGEAIASKDWVSQAMHFASSDEPILEPEPKPKPKPKASRNAKTRKGGAKVPAKRAAVVPTTKAESGSPVGSTGEAPLKRKRKTGAAESVGKRGGRKAAAGQQVAEVPGADAKRDAAAAPSATSATGPATAPSEE